MAYRIVYGPMPEHSRQEQPGLLRLQTMTAVFLLLFVLLVRQIWPEGTQLLRSYLLPAELTVTETAFMEFVDDIQAGEPLGDAVTAFCQQVIEDGIPAED